MGNVESRPDFYVRQSVSHKAKNFDLTFSKVSAFLRGLGFGYQLKLVTE